MSDPLPHRLAPFVVATRDAGDGVQMTCPLHRDGMVTKATILQNLVAHLSLPETFGHNWDAAFDSLLDWADTHPGCTKLEFVHPPSACVNAQDMATFLEVIGDANEHLAQRGSRLRFEVSVPGSVKDTDADPRGG